MPQANDAELTELYTASLGVDVEDNEPNTGPPGPAGQHLRPASAGGGRQHHRRQRRQLLAAGRLHRRDPGSAQRQHERGPLNQQFSGADGWVAAGGNFVKDATTTINVDPAARGHVLRYVASLVSVNGDVVSFIESNKFILI